MACMHTVAVPQEFLQANTRIVCEVDLHGCGRMPVAGWFSCCIKGPNSKSHLVGLHLHDAPRACGALAARLDTASSGD
jgi:hypothetical protein